MNGSASTIRRRDLGEQELSVTVAGLCMEIPVNCPLYGMRILLPIHLQSLCLITVDLVAWTNGLWTSPHMTNGYVVIAENQNHKFHTS